MGFGLNVKVEAPKVEVPKVDVASAVSSVTNAVSGAVDSAKNAANDAVNAATSAVNDAVSSATSAVNGAVSAATEAASAAVKVATSAVASLTTVAGAIADVAVSFTGKIEDFALEPHLSLDANASFGNTKFEKGPIWIRVECPAEEAKTNMDVIRIYCGSKAFDEQRKVAEFNDNDAETVVLKFENAPMDEAYTLEVIPGNGGTARILFKDVTYGNIRNTRQRFVAA